MIFLLIAVLNLISSIVISYHIGAGGPKIILIPLVLVQLAIGICFLKLWIKEKIRIQILAARTSSFITESLKRESALDRVLPIEVIGPDALVPKRGVQSDERARELMEERYAAK